MATLNIVGRILNLFDLVDEENKVNIYTPYIWYRYANGYRVQINNETNTYTITTADKGYQLFCNYNGKYNSNLTPVVTDGDTNINMIINTRTIKDTQNYKFYTPGQELFLTNNNLDLNKVEWKIGSAEPINSPTYTIKNVDVGKTIEVKHVDAQAYQIPMIISLIESNSPIVNKEWNYLFPFDFPFSLSISYDDTVEHDQKWVDFGLLDAKSLTGTPTFKNAGPNNFTINMTAIIDNTKTIYFYNVELMVQNDDEALPSEIEVYIDSIKTTTTPRLYDGMIYNVDAVVKDERLFYNTTSKQLERDQLTFTAFTIINEEMDEITDNYGAFQKIGVVTQNTDEYTETRFSFTFVPSLNAGDYTCSFKFSGTQQNNFFETNLNITMSTYRYYIPDILSSARQGSYFEKYIFIISSSSQTSLLIEVEEKPDWMEISQVSTYSYIKAGILLLSSKDESRPNTCDNIGTFNIKVKVIDSEDNILYISNQLLNAGDENNTKYFDSSQFVWSTVVAAEALRDTLPRASTYPCFVCEKNNEDETDVNLQCKNKYSKYDLDMRRKAETLKYKDKLFGFTQIVKNIKQKANAGNKYIAIATPEYLAQNKYKLIIMNESCPRPRHYASQSDVPGNKTFELFLDPSVPVVNYIPVRRVYNSSNESTQTAYKIGDAGFPVGKSGTLTKINVIQKMIVELVNIEIESAEQIIANQNSIKEILSLLLLGSNVSEDDLEFILPNPDSIRTENNYVVQIIFINSVNQEQLFNNMTFLLEKQILQIFFSPLSLSKTSVSNVLYTMI